MDHTEYNKCIEILRSKPKWFGADENLAMKLECLETFQSKGSPSNIHALVPFLKSCNEVIMQRTAEVIVMLFEKLKSQNQGGDVDLKRMILILYSAVGGWDVLPRLIKATADLDLNAKELAWNFLQRWREKALRLFIRPPKEVIENATSNYESIGFVIAEVSPSKRKLWDEIR